MDIENLSYTDFISLIREENRPPGGKKTVRELLINSFANKKSKILEVGCTNGFTTLEIARTIGCRTYGIDINKKSLENAKKRVINEKAKFRYGSAYNIPFKKEYFDIVFCGNATSFMENKNKAVSEYKRVVKKWGFIAVSPMYYIKNPTREIVQSISSLIGTNIDVRTKKEWMELFKRSGLEIYYCKDYEFYFKSKKEIDEYVEESLNKEHLKYLPKGILKKIEERWKKTITIFNKNLSYVGYSVILLRKRGEPEEVELFNSKEIQNGK